MKLVQRIVMIVLLLLAGNNINSVYADSFWPYGDVLDCQFVHTEAIGITSLPLNIIPLVSLTGNNTTNVINKNIMHVANILKGSLERYAGVDDGVSVPGGAKISLIWYWNNYSGHTVYVKNLWLYVDQSDIFEPLPLSYHEMYYIENGVLLYKLGNALQMGAQGNMQPNSFSSSPYGKEVLQLTVKQPLTMQIKHTECSISSEKGLITRIWGTMNNSGKLVEQISVEGDNFTVLPGETVDIYKEIPAGKDTVSLNILNSPKNCITSNHAIIMIRGDEGNFYWSGAQYDISTNGRQSLCVTRIPYQIKIPVPSCSIPSYELLLPESFEMQQVNTGESVEISIPVTGNIPQSGIVLPVMVKIPDDWKDFVKINTPEQAITNDGKTTVVTTVSVASYIPASLPQSFVFDVEIGGKTVHIPVTVHHQSQITWTVGTPGSCSFTDETGSYTIPVQVSISGNEVLHDLPLQIALSSNVIRSVLQIHDESHVVSAVAVSGIVKLHGNWGVGDYSGLMTVTIPASEKSIAIVNGNSITVTCIDMSPPVTLLVTPALAVLNTPVPPIMSVNVIQFTEEKSGYVSIQNSDNFSYFSAFQLMHQKESVMHLPFTGISTEKIAPYDALLSICAAIASICMNVTLRGIPKKHRERNRTFFSVTALP